MKTKKLFNYLTVALCLLIFSCNKKEKKDTSETVQITTTIASVLENSEFSILKAALAKAGLNLDEALTGDFTIFAPNNAAFAAANITDLNTVTTEQLTAILTYHVVAGKTLTSDQITENAIEATTLNADKKLSVFRENGDVFVTDIFGKKVKVIAADVTAQKGVIHVIDNVLIPEAAVVAPVNPLLTALNTTEFAGIADFVKMLEDKGLLETLKNETELTIFAMPNAQFKTSKISDDQLNYRILKTSLKLDDKGAAIETLQGKKMFFSKLNLADDQLIVNGFLATKIKSSFKKSGLNLHVYELAGDLTPPTKNIMTLMTQLTEEGKVDPKYSAPFLKSINMKEFIKTQNGVFTTFATTVSTLSTPTANNFRNQSLGSVVFLQNIMDGSVLQTLNIGDQYVEFSKNSDGDIELFIQQSKIKKVKLASSNYIATDGIIHVIYLLL
jgi:uncharacterized surface protein with fasciclin (FAS1) repeats